MDVIDKERPIMRRVNVTRTITLIRQHLYVQNMRVKTIGVASDGDQ